MRACAPTVTVAVVWTTIIAAAPGLVLVASGDVFVETLARRLGLPGFIWPRLDRQIALTVLRLPVLYLSLLRLSLLLLLLFLALLLLPVLLLLLLLALLLLTLLLIALLVGSLLVLILALLFTLLLTLLLLTLLLLTLLLLNLLLLLLLLVLLLLLPAVGIATVGLTWIIVLGQTLHADAQRQQADTCQKPDARFHAFLTAARILIDRTAFTLRRSRHSISESARIESSRHLDLSAFNHRRILRRSGSGCFNRQHKQSGKPVTAAQMIKGQRN